MNLKSRTAIITGVLFGLVMLVGLPLYIFSVLNKYSKISGQSDAVVYLLNGKPVLATVIKEFKANSVSSGGGASVVSGSSKSYARAIDLETGNPLWNIRLDAENNNGQDWGDAVLLGQSDKYLFFLRNELYVISKENGKIVARNEDLKDMRNKLLNESSIYPALVNNYVYDDSLHAIAIKGSDGLAYLLDINTLQTHPAPQINITDYFFEKQRYIQKTAAEDYNSQLVTFTRDNSLQFAFMDDNDYQLLKKGEKPSYGHMEAPRRTLYTAALSNPLTSMKKTDDEVYLYGGFLKSVRQDSVLYSPKDRNFYNGPYQLLSRGAGDVQIPLRLPGGGYIILHRASVAKNAPVLLTAISPDGKKLWHITTGVSAINRVLMVKGQLLILACTVANSSGEVSDILSISLADGKARTYNFKKEQFN